MVDAKQFLDLMDERNAPPKPYRLGTVVTAGARPTIRFDGETSASPRTYPVLAHYAPVAGDRVMLAVFDHSMVVVGKVV